MTPPPLISYGLSLHTFLMNYKSNRNYYDHDDCTASDLFKYIYNPYNMSEFTKIIIYSSSNFIDQSSLLISRLPNFNLKKNKKKNKTFSYI